MKYVRLGNTGLKVSKLCLGCMSFGDPDKWVHKWALREDDSREVIKAALEQGINFFDTANVYSKGESEEILGRALKDFADRDDVVIATKVFSRMRDTPNGAGLSRKAIMSEIDHSLRRLGTDYVDLYITHRWDYETPIEETMEALHDVVKAGKARYIGASAMYAYQFQKSQHVAEINGWTKYVSMQNHMNLIYREDERELVPYCREEGIALTPYSPLAAGRLARDLSETTVRYDTDTTAKSKYDHAADADAAVIERLREVAEAHGVPRAQIALAWLMQRQPVTIPILGVSKVSHVTSAVPAVDIVLTEDEIARLEEPYVPHRVIGANPPPKA